MEFAIEVNDVTRSYGAHFSLEKINLKDKKREVFALIGQNGAGKTTLVKLILDLLRTTEGDINLSGISSIDSHSREKVGFIPEKFSFFGFYTVGGVLDFFAESRGFVGAEKKAIVENALKKLTLEDIRTRKLSTFSKGQLQRVGLATLLIGELDILILDEPFSGLDPIGIKDLKDLIKEFKLQGKTVFINSHILLEMGQLCDSFAVLKNGKLVHSGSVASMKEKHGNLEDFFTKLVMES